MRFTRTRRRVPTDPTLWTEAMFFEHGSDPNVRPDVAATAFGHLAQLVSGGSWGTDVRRRLRLVLLARCDLTPELLLRAMLTYPDYLGRRELAMFDDHPSCDGFVVAGLVTHLCRTASVSIGCAVALEQLIEVSPRAAFANALADLGADQHEIAAQLDPRPPDLVCTIASRMAPDWSGDRSELLDAATDITSTDVANLDVTPACRG